MAPAGLPAALGAAGVHQGLQALGGWLRKHCTVNFPSLQLANSLNEERQQTQMRQCYNLLLGDESGWILCLLIYPENLIHQKMI